MELSRVYTGPESCVPAVIKMLSSSSWWTLMLQTKWNVTHPK